MKFLYLVDKGKECKISSYGGFIRLLNNSCTCEYDYLLIICLE